MTSERLGGGLVPIDEGPNFLGISNSQAEAGKAIAEFGTASVTEGSKLARYFAKVIGTVPEDAIGLFIGDPINYWRRKNAMRYDGKIEAILKRRNVTDREPVSPSLAVPLLTAAYDETRPELQKLWAELIAAAMDPKRASQVRLSFINVLRQFDPLDALVLKIRYDYPMELQPNVRDNLASRLAKSNEDIQMSSEHLAELKCFQITTVSPYNYVLTLFGKMLIKACVD